MEITSKKHLGFKSLIKGFKSSFGECKDPRVAHKTTYSIMDTMLSGLACMFYKSPSMLQFQRAMEKRTTRCNLQTQFGVKKIPKDNQMREITGLVPSEALAPVFKEYLSRLQRSNYLKEYVFEGMYLLTLDGTQFYRSKEISCDRCLETNRKGVTTYSHSAVQPIISHPEKKQIFPLMPEEICHRDGDNKQDCETNAAKRLIVNIRNAHPRMRFIHMGDALYANTPYINEIRKKADKFIFRIKTGSHGYAHDVFEQADHHSFEQTNKQGKRLVHKWVNDVPLFKDSSIKVTVMRLFVVSTDKEGNQKSEMVGTWVTDLKVSDINIAQVVKAARSRWKIENETFNVLKNHGYNLTHIWGHVNEESFNFYILTLLGFYIHQILELSDRLFCVCRKKAGAAYALWDELKVLFHRVLYDSWENLLMDFLAGFLDPPKV